MTQPNNTIIKTPDELEIKINEYIEDCTSNKKRMTRAGFTYHCGYASKTSLWDLRNRKRGGKDFTYQLDRIDLLMEDRLAQDLMKSGQPTAGIIFYMKNNHGYRDSKELTGDKGGPIKFEYVSNIKRSTKKEEA